MASVSGGKYTKHLLQAPGEQQRGQGKDKRMPREVRARTIRPAAPANRLQDGATDSMARRSVAAGSLLTLRAACPARMRRTATAIPACTRERQHTGSFRGGCKRLEFAGSRRRQVRTTCSPAVIAETDLHHPISIRASAHPD